MSLSLPSTISVDWSRSATPNNSQNKGLKGLTFRANTNQLKTLRLDKLHCGTAVLEEVVAHRRLMVPLSQGFRWNNFKQVTQLDAVAQIFGDVVNLQTSLWEKLVGPTSEGLSEQQRKKPKTLKASPQRRFFFFFFETQVFGFNKQIRKEKKGTSRVNVTFCCTSTHVLSSLMVSVCCCECLVLKG